MKLFIASILVLITVSVMAEQPNIIVILCDDLGYADVGFNGATDIVTPKLDSLAENGTIFTSAYVTHSFCGPSRMGLMSGRYPHDIGAPFNLPAASNGIAKYNAQGIDVNETLMSTVLQEAGYFTGAIGKWHMGIKPQFHPNTRGFDDYYGFLGGGHRYFPDQYRPQYERAVQNGSKNIWDYILPLEHNGVEVNETEYITDALSREAVRFVTEAATKDQPFFLYLAYNAPHTPLEAKQEDMAVFASILDKDRQSYAGMVCGVDRGVGEVVDALKATGQFDDTLIVFLSDNGGKESQGANNGVLREGKGSVYEGGYRVPMFWHWPQHVPAGKRYHHPVTALDFYPTFARLANATIPEGKHLDGTDIWDDFLADHSPRQGGMIYVLRHRAGQGYSDVSARKDQWKACRIYRQKWKLFNIVQDIGENNDLSALHPEILSEMVSEAKRWSQSHTDPLWYDSLKAEADWMNYGMPNYDVTFSLD